MRRVVVLGPGAAGKSVFAERLGAVTGLPVFELDRLFWGPGLAPLPAEEWARRQQPLVAPRTWILDGDLGPYDVLDVRLTAADTVIVLHLPLRVCLWRALRRSRERWDFWLWLLRWRWDSLPELRRHLDARIATRDPVTAHFLRSGRQIEAFLRRAEARGAQAEND